MNGTQYVVVAGSFDNKTNRLGVMEFFMEMAPPTSTAQMKKVSVVHGRPVFYEPKAVKEAKAVLVAGLLPHVPPSPLMGPLELRTVWLYPRGEVAQER